MAATSFSITPDNTSDATFRAWGSAWHNAIAGLGVLVQTSDTGQINWSTETRAMGGYEMWRFNDSLQGTAPVFIKIAVGTGPAISFHVGTATDGAGNFIGTTIDSAIFASSSSTTSQTGEVSATASRFTLLLPQAGQDWIAVGVERAMDNTGAALSTGIVGAIAGNTFWLASGASAPASNSAAHALRCIRNEASNLVGTQCTVFPVNALGTNFQVQNPILSFLWYWSTDIGLGGSMACTLYGTSHTYINPNATPNGASYAGQMSSSMRLLMLFE